MCPSVRQLSRRSFLWWYLHYALALTLMKLMLVGDEAL